MKLFLSLVSAVATFLTPAVVALLPLAVRAADDDGKKDEKEKDPDLIFQAGFDDQKVGDVPDDYFVIEGEWSVVGLEDEDEDEDEDEEEEEEDCAKALKLSADPLGEAQVQVGDSLKDIGGTIRARVRAEKKRRAYPRFGVGLHGMSGYRLRLFPVRNRMELVKSEEVIRSAGIEWKSGEWWVLELTVKPSADAWSISARAWPEGADRPDKAQIETTSAATKFSGRAVLTGTPYAGLPIYFDDIEVRQIVVKHEKKAK